MRDQKLDEYHDLAIENDDLVNIEGLDEMVQACRIASLICKYEYWLDGNLGIPWNHGMFYPWTTQEEKELHTKQAFLNVEGVSSVQDVIYTDDVANKSASIEVKNIETVEGTITGIGLE